MATMGPEQTGSLSNKHGRHVSPHIVILCSVDESVTSNLGLNRFGNSRYSASEMPAALGVMIGQESSTAGQ